MNAVARIRTTGQENLTGRWIARAQHEHLVRLCTYQIGGFFIFF